MRLTPLLRGSRTPQNESKVPFQAILPLALKHKVSGKGEKTADVSCLQEMTVLFFCLKENEFSQQLCSNEVQQFQTCYKEKLKQQELKKEQEAKGGFGTNPRTMSSTTINRVLRRFPPPGKRL